MTFTINVTPVSCERCGYNAQFNWSGHNVCGLGCYELLTLQESKDPIAVAIGINKLLGDSVQGVQDTIGNLVVEGEKAVKLPATTYSRYYPNKNTWVIELSRYHRDNLLWLFNCIGYPNGQGVEPFTCANTGDWAGEIPIMLSKPGKDCVLDETDRPNVSVAELKNVVDFWLNRKK